jgi:DNA invertase Pin-like site-specific DNA recombinase
MAWHNPWYHRHMFINAVIYARTSPDCPIAAEDQIEHLKSAADQHGWVVTRVFTARPMPMRKGRERRPGEAALFDMTRSSGVQRVLVWSIDRVGRSLVELVTFMETCRAPGVGLYLHEQELDTTTSNGLPLLDVAGMMALHLRQSRRDKILRGQAEARGANIRFGRPPIAATKVEKAMQGLAAAKGVRQVARLAGISAASGSRLVSAHPQFLCYPAGSGFSGACPAARNRLTRSRATRF